jgi:hypothetical protein
LETNELNHLFNCHTSILIFFLSEYLLLDPKKRAGESYKGFFWKKWPKITIFEGGENLKPTLLDNITKTAYHQNIEGIQKNSNVLSNL